MKMLFDFREEVSPANWQATNDGVMGGRSQGRPDWVEQGLRFSGVLSLENNGGFSWIHTSGPFDLGGYSGIRLKVLGDGRTYQLRLQSDAMIRRGEPVAFSGTIATVAGEWVELFIPFDELQQSWRGRKLRGYSFNPEKIQRIGFMLADKQPGPFEMKISWVAADH